MSRSKSGHASRSCEVSPPFMQQPRPSIFQPQSHHQWQMGGFANWLHQRSGVKELGPQKNSVVVVPVFFISVNINGLIMEPVLVEWGYLKSLLGFSRGQFPPATPVVFTHAVIGAVC